jgi:hypothetical protein
MKTISKMLTVLISVATIASFSMPIYASRQGLDAVGADSSSVGSAEQERVDLDEADVLIQAISMFKMFFHPEFTDEMIDNRIVIPLYDDDDEICAYYVEIEGVGSVVIHNNRLCPEPVEIGEADLPMIKNIHNSSPSGKVYYGGPMDYRSEPTLEGKWHNSYHKATAALDAKRNEVALARLDKYHALIEAYLESKGDHDEAASEDVYSSAFVTSLDETDVMIMAFRALYGDGESENFWPEDESNRIIIPLYDDAYDVVAYYLSFENGGYAVVNNNSTNPAVIEFGSSDNPEIKAILDSGPEIRIIYDNPFSVRTKPLGYNFTPKTDLLAMKGNYYQCNAAFQEPDVELAKTLADARKAVEGGLRYSDFYAVTPGQIQDERTINYAAVNNWMTESAYSPSATACTATVTSTNLAILFRNRGYSSVAENDALQTFYNVADYTNIQSAWNPSGLSSYFSNVGGYTLSSSLYTRTNYSPYALYSKVKNGVNANKPSAISVSIQNGFKWVLGLGWRETADGDFMKVVRNDSSTGLFYVHSSADIVTNVYVYNVNAFNSDAGAFISRLYNICLCRPEDDSGLISWLNVIYNPTYGADSVAEGFFLSQEFINRGRNDADFLWGLYHAMFDREADAGGYNAWMSYMLEGHSRAEVIYGFTHSQEFYNLCSSYNVYP